MREGRVVHRNLAEVLETLVHEMANANLFLFACRYKLCQKQKGLNLGVWRYVAGAEAGRVRGLEMRN